MEVHSLRYVAVISHSAPSVKIMRVRACRTNDKWRNLFRFHMDDAILVLDLPFDANESFMHDYHRVSGVNVRHYDHVGVSSFVLQCQEN
jgi:hypothetical protein